MRRILAAVLLTTFSVAIALAAIEIGVRVLHLVPATFFEPDAVLGTRLIPGRRGWWTQEELEFRTPVQINREGFRDVDHAREKPDGVTRILVLGDSFVEAMQVPLEATVARRLQAELDPEAKLIEVISMGISGFGTAGELLLYERFGRAYRPDVVLLNFYAGNDVRNNSPELEPGLPPAYAADGSVERIVAPARPREKGAIGRLLAWSHGYRFVRKRIITRNPDLAALLVRWRLLSKKTLDRVPSVGGVPVDYWVFAKDGGPQAAQWADAWRHTEHLLDRFRSVVERDGARFVISIATLRERVYPDSWTEILRTYPAMQRIDWDLGRPEARVEEWCHVHEVPCVSLTPVFLAQRDGARLHWVYDGHWTEAGHALAARTIADALRAQNVIQQKVPNDGAADGWRGSTRARHPVPRAASTRGMTRDHLRSHKSNTCCSLDEVEQWRAIQDAAPAKCDAEWTSSVDLGFVTPDAAGHDRQCRSFLSVSTGRERTVRAPVRAG